MMRLLAAALAAAAPLLGAAQEPTGRILVSVGVCNDSLVELPSLHMRKVDKSAHQNVFGASFGMWDYTDDTGKFVVAVRTVPAGQWEMFNHAMKWVQFGRTTRYSSRRDYSLAFTVEPGKVIDLGRYCAASQSEGEVFPDSKDTVSNQVVRFAYFLVSANREADIENARKPEGGGEPLVLVQARPNPPERVSLLFRSRHVVPRVIAKPAQPNWKEEELRRQ